jgi:hypothetical protein
MVNAIEISTILINNQLLKRQTPEQQKECTEKYCQISVSLRWQLIIHCRIRPTRYDKVQYFEPHRILLLTETKLRYQDKRGKYHQKTNHRITLDNRWSPTYYITYSNKLDSHKIHFVF